MSDDPEDENRDIPDEVSIALVDFRAQTFDGLATDALTIISIQLIILPLSVSALSLLFQLDVGDVSPSTNNSSSAFIQDEGDLTSLFANLLIVLFILTVAIGLAVDSYRQARSKSHNSYNLLRNSYHSKTNEGPDFSHLSELLQTSAENAYSGYRSVSEVASIVSNRVLPSVELSERDRLLAEFGGEFSDESTLRLQLILSLFLTFAALIWLLRTLLAPLFEQADLIVLLIVVFVGLGIVYVFLGRTILPIAAAFLQKPGRYLLAVPLFLYGSAYALFLLSRSCISYTISQGRNFTIGVALLACYLLGLFVGTLFRQSLFQGNSYSIFVIILLFAGLSGIGYMLSWKLSL